MCEVSCKNSERLIRKWQNLRGQAYLFVAHCIMCEFAHFYSSRATFLT